MTGEPLPSESFRRAAVVVEAAVRRRLVEAFGPTVGVTVAGNVGLDLLQRADVTVTVGNNWPWFDRGADRVAAEVVDLALDQLRHVRPHSLGTQPESVGVLVQVDCRLRTEPVGPGRLRVSVSSTAYLACDGCGRELEFAESCTACQVRSDRG